MLCNYAHMYTRTCETFSMPTGRCDLSVAVCFRTLYILNPKPVKTRRLYAELSDVEAQCCLVGARVSVTNTSHKTHEHGVRGHCVYDDCMRERERELTRATMRDTMSAICSNQHAHARTPRHTAHIQAQRGRQTQIAPSSPNISHRIRLV